MVRIDDLSTEDALAQLKAVARQGQELRRARSRVLVHDNESRRRAARLSIEIQSCDIRHKELRKLLKARGALDIN